MYWRPTGTSRSSPTAVPPPGFRLAEWEAVVQAHGSPLPRRPFPAGRCRGSGSRGRIVRAGFPGRRRRSRRASQSAHAAVAECRQPESSMRCHTLDMKTHAALRPIVAMALVVALLSGCSLFGDGPKWGPSGTRTKRPARCRRCRNPLPTHRFEIDPTTDIVGVVQKTRATKEDTLTDIARRFNVGYEEIVRANPGVDPWLPGEDSEIVIPSQFILPNAPREGIVINCRGDATLLLPEGEEGRAAGRAHLSHRHRQGGLEDAGRRDQDRAPAEGSHLASDRHPSSRSIARSAARSSTRSSARVRTIRSAATRSISAGRAT